MQSKYSFFFWLNCLLFSICWIGGSKGEEPALSFRAIDRVSLEVKIPTYTKRWAVVVGINYTDIDLPEGSRKIVPVLNNAENDAQAFADLLIKHYGYDKDSLKLLKGKDATGEAIKGAISGQFLGKKSVSQNDSILFFFAGHGYYNEKEQRAGELLPWDVKVDGDIPVLSSCIRMEGEVVEYMKKSPARHKLTILDCCHSGYVFNSKQQAERRSEKNIHFDAGLFSTPAFQAIASCRGEEKASDGKDGHSFFTASILSALKVIPRQQGVSIPIKTSDLFYKLSSELRQYASSNDQKAQYGWLSINQGEFHFFPDIKSDFSGYSKQSEDEMMNAITIAMAPGTYGAWWFEEMPWFIPSLRSRILASLVKTRSSTNSWVRKENLKKSANDLLLNMEKDASPLIQMRVKHLKLLLNHDNGQSVGDVFKEIERDLRKPQEFDLQSTDLHLLALIEHRLAGKARDTYNKAILSYDRELQSGEKDESKALRLLCYADLGQFEFQQNDYDQAAITYQRALEQRVLCPVPFQVYVLASEANAWQQLGCWGEADVKLDQAIRLALTLAKDAKDSGSPLTAFAYHRRAWAYMEQWKFSKAAEAFNLANAYLGENDREADIVRFHNRHGLAMALRFTGDPDDALASYREISKDISIKLSELRTSQGVESNFTDVRQRFATRLVNTLERQADCNLFKDKGDLKEAADDLRRAIRVNDFLPPGDQRNLTKATQLYKLALVLGKRSINQDLDLALGCLKEGDGLFEKLNDDQKIILGYHRKLARAIVELGGEFQLVETEGGDTATKKEKCNTALSVLRKAIADLKPQLNSPIHRDNLEVLLFATVVLITEDLGKADRYMLLADSEILLLLCQHAMRSDPLETQRYLRHYFDTAIRAMIAARPKHVQGIIEATYEARIARPYNKPSISGPSLVFYYLDDRFHAFLDIPNGISKEYLFDEGVDLDVLKDAEKNQRRLPLPRQLVKDLASLKLEKALVLSAEQILSAEQDLPSTECLQIQWTDSLYSLGANRQICLAGEFNSVTRSVVKKPISPVITKFPFMLPGLQVNESPTATPKLPLSPKE